MSDKRGKYRFTMLVILAFTLLAVYISLTNGTFDMTVMDVIRTLLRMDPVADHDLVIFDFRLPRIVIAALVGFGLGVAGTVIQGITRNSIADPGILGINAGAGTAIVAFMFFFSGKFAEADWFSMFAMPLFGLTGGLLAAALIYVFAWRNGALDPQRLILVGIAIGYGLGSVTIYMSLKMNPNDFEMATVWLTGSIWNANWTHITGMLPWLIILVPILLRKAHILDLMQLGEESVKSLGVRTDKERNALLLASIGIVSACVSVSGGIGFVGLMAPHIAKRLIGIQHRYVLPLSGVVGMLMVVAADFLAKTVFTPVELPVGIVISIIGVPYFFYLLKRAKK